MRPQRDEREQAEQRRRSPRDRRIGPLPLGFHAEMATDLGEVTSVDQRRTNQRRMSTGAALRGVRDDATAQCRKRLLLFVRLGHSSRSP